MMSSNSRWAIPLTGLALIVAGLACNLPGGATPTATPEPPPESGEPAATAPPAEAPAATEAPAETATETATVIHSMFPENPTGQDNFMTDRSSESTAPERYTVGENYNQNLLERPFTSQEMDYRNNIDIVRGEIQASAPWFYFTIFLVGSLTDDPGYFYCVEIDLNMNGRGNWLICGETPSSSDWTVVGVSAYNDTNGDVGGAVPIQAEAPPPVGDSYDNLAFFQGEGTGPDDAWIRRGTGNQIQIAIKQSLIGNDVQFVWGVWSGREIQAMKFDINDHYTIEQAGSPLQDNPNYPVKEVAETDNTCRWIFGFMPSTPIPGLCPFATPTNTPLPVPTSTPTVTPTSSNTPIPPPS